MKKLGIILVGVLILSACTNKKVVEYNSERVEMMEKYLQNNKMLKTTQEFEKLKKEGKIMVNIEHKSLEKEAEIWKEKIEN